jgi:cell wall-associated NlpC family hydrolase
VGSKFPSAIKAWEGATIKHRGRDPRPGFPVFFSGGRFGHIALSLGGDKIRTTDWPSKGRVGTTTIGELERRWGKVYVGWTEDLNGHRLSG